jgi:hypothetical protein
MAKEKYIPASDILGKNYDHPLNESRQEELMENSNRFEERSIDDMVNEGDFYLGGDNSEGRFPYKQRKRE